MIFSSSSPLTFTDPLDQPFDAVIIGGGVIGISTAWFLAKAGLRVAVCEKGRVAGEQSSRNWGWVRQQGRDESELPIMMESNRIWHELAAELGEGLGFRQHGVMYVAETEQEMQRYEEWVNTASRHGLESLLLTAEQVRQRVIGFEGNWKGAVVTPSDGRAEPFEAVPTLARGCQRLGVAIAEDCAVRGVSYSAGKVSGVVTELGEVRCQAVVCAGGAWSSLFMRHLGFRFPQLSVKSTVVRTAPTRDIYNGNVSCDDLAIRRRVDGGYTLAPADYNEHFISADSFRYLKTFLPTLREAVDKTALKLGSEGPGGVAPSHRWREDGQTPFERNRVLNPLPAESTLQRVRTSLRRRLPGLGEVPFAECWAGMIDTSPDIVPTIDALPGTDGLYLASGFSGHGFGIGPGAGRVMADLVQGNDTGHNLHRFRFSRFSDGSRLEPGPTL